MKSLITANPGMFPLRSSLFWHDSQGGGWEGTGYKATWELLHRGFNQAYRDRLLNKQVEYGCNFLTFYLYHYDDPNCNINPFVGCPGPTAIATGKAIWDWAEINKWLPYLELGKNPDLWIVPTLFCGDSKGATLNTAFHDMFIPPIVQAIHPLVKAINIGSEMSKTINKAQMERMINVVKNSWKAAGQVEKPVGVHLQCDREGNLPIPVNADFIMLQTSNHPKNFNDNIVTEIEKVVAKCPTFVLVTETYIFCEEARAKKQVRDIASIPNVWCLPGPR